MLIKSLILLVLTTSAFGKTLSVNCTDADNDTLSFTADWANINKAPDIQEFLLNGQEINFKDNSTAPFYEDGKISGKINFSYNGNMYNSLKFNVQNCDDSFTSGGTATISIYVGGYAGDQESSADCSCALE